MFKAYKIQLKTKYKYLGVELDQSLNLGPHFESTYRKAAAWSSKTIYCPR